MRQDNEANVCRWEEDRHAWRVERERSKQEAFLNAGTPAEQAAYDLPRFIKHYFLTDGKLDPSKTPEPLVLHGYANTYAIHNAAAEIPGLESCSGGTGNSRTVCIGSDRDKVYIAAGKLDQLAHKAEEEAMRATWETAMGEHHKFISQQGRGKKGRQSKTESKTFDLITCAGSYIIQSKEIASEWPDQTTMPFTMDFAIPQAERDIVAAAFDFRILEGTMLLNLNEEALEEYDDRDDDGDNDEDNGSHVPPKRKASSSLPASRQAKKKKGTATKGNRTSHRVYFRARGRETGEGEISYTPESGYIDFLDDEGFAFDGMADSLSCVGPNVAFSGYKISAQPKRKAESWGSFSYGAYEKGRMGRW